MTRPISNPRLDTRARLRVESVFLSRPETSWTYSHHPALAQYGGRLFAIWSNGRENEDDLGQRVVWSSSADGASWSEPQPLVDSMRGRHSEVVLCAGGLYAHPGGLNAYIGRYEYRPESIAGDTRAPRDAAHVDTSLLVCTTRDGSVWSGPADLHLPVVPNHGPQPTASGRLILSGSIAFPYTDDRSGLVGWMMAGIYPPAMDPVQDDSEGFWIAKELAGWPVGPCEGSFYQTDDGVLHMLLRSGTPWLWVTESTDDGESWSVLRQTAFTDNISKFHFGRLPNGRFFYVGCPDPPRAGAPARSPLVLSLSEDGYTFDRHFVLGEDHYEMRRPGMFKGGEYGYPHALVARERLHVIVSRQKEAIEILHVAIDDL